MEARLATTPELLPDFLEVAETGYGAPNDLSFETQRYLTEDIGELSVILDRLGITPVSFRWGEHGAMVDFADSQDLALFKIAYTERNALTK